MLNHANTKFLKLAVYPLLKKDMFILFRLFFAASLITLNLVRRSLTTLHWQKQGSKLSWHCPFKSLKVLYLGRYTVCWWPQAEPYKNQIRHKFFSNSCHIYISTAPLHTLGVLVLGELIGPVSCCIEVHYIEMQCISIVHPYIGCARGADRTRHVLDRFAL